jgi:hypothetical protein
LGTRKVYIGPIAPQSFVLEDEFSENEELETGVDDVRTSLSPITSPEVSQDSPSSVNSGTMPLLRRSSLSSTPRRITNDNSAFSSRAIRSEIHQIVADAIAEMRDQLSQPNLSSNISTSLHTTRPRGRNRRTVSLQQRNAREESSQLESDSAPAGTLDLDMESSDNESILSLTAALMPELSSTRAQHSRSSESQAIEEFDLTQAGSLSLNIL